jgi:hypothetical protein
MTYLSCGNGYYEAKQNKSLHLSVFAWYRILRQHNHWGILEAIKYALWLRG